MKKLNINYVSLFRYALNQIVSKNIRFRDVALYYSILQCWNKYRFPEILSVNRQELMAFSKIGSYNTYLKSLHNLEREGLIKYYPSKDPCVGSKISICFDNSVLNQNLTLPRHKVDTTVRASLNNSKQEKTIETIKKKDVINFFKENGSTEKMAEQFFNHNRGVNWMYKGSPITDWKSFALNYIDKNKKISSKVKTNEASKVSKASSFGTLKKHIRHGK